MTTYSTNTLACPTCGGDPAKPDGATQLHTGDRVTCPECGARAEVIIGRRGVITCWTPGDKQAGDK